MAQRDYAALTSRKYVRRGRYGDYEYQRIFRWGEADRPGADIPSNAPQIVIALAYGLPMAIGLWVAMAGLVAVIV